MANILEVVPDKIKESSMGYLPGGIGIRGLLSHPPCKL
jgi:hypothetical protein